ncbi:MAG: prepilin-type N-terminal cleavage/methylation domain-containing protein [Hydrogenibacillus schlegelii]|uniref:Prepilin-type N-terminal cleavage/methylation domain-containing protein n=1 Tax=Hydrogenibacillus schlegelii TaxID=1484 RepID=A0A947G879_HYDSH|nr:prepilin-type N-terminal cleavage/methylation domain-containing protein [Hydrogenibacillus schlegelii]
MSVLFLFQGNCHGKPLFHPTGASASGQCEADRAFTLVEVLVALGLTLLLALMTAQLLGLSRLTLARSESESDAVRRIEATARVFRTLSDEALRRWEASPADCPVPPEPQGRWHACPSETGTSDPADPTGGGLQCCVRTLTPEELRAAFPTALSGEATRFWGIRIWVGGPLGAKTFDVWLRPKEGTP